MGHLSSHLVAALVAAVLVLQVVRYASWRSRQLRTKGDLGSTTSRRVH